MSIKFAKHDGGRAAAGFKGSAGDCVTRAICIATGLPYTIVYDRLALGNATQRHSKKASRSAGKHTAAHGIYTNRQWFKDYMRSLGFVWYPMMAIGTGCKVHLKSTELPTGKLVVRVSGHLCAVINGVLCDTHDCSRNGTRCVYGYYKLEGV